MNGNEVLRIVDSIHRDKSIDKEIVFEGVEQAILSAARKHFGEEELIDVRIDRASGQPQVTTNGREIDRDELGDILGRISAQTAKQVMIQKIREAERDTLFDEFAQMRSQIVSGTITRNEGSAITVNIGKAEAILPRSEMIPGESHRPNERVRAVILEVKKMGPRVRVVLSRAHPDFVRRLLELEIPEVSERIIEIRSLAREAGYRTKVAVSCIDSNIDPVGACVGVRGARIRNVGEELGGERIEVVRWNDSLQVLVPNAMQPAEVEDVILCPMLGRVLVLVRDDQLSLAIGKRGQNVRLASKLVGWDIDVMTREELDQQLDLAVVAYSQIPGVTEELAEGLVSQGFLSFEDLSVIEPDQLMEMGSLTQEQADVIVEYAEKESERIEKEQDVRRATEKAERQSQEREQRRLDELARLAGPKPAVVTVVAEEAVEASEVPEESKTEAVATVKVEAEGTAGN
jgi:N utilization substance protein A